MTPEIRLLLACARLRPDGVAAARIRELIRGEIDWSRFLELATGHGVRPLTYQSLHQCCWSAVPETIQQQLRAFCAANVGRNFLLTRELLRVLQAFDAEHLASAAFKGPLLAECAYGNIGLREFSDLDFLIAERDISRARLLLSRLGYEST